MNRKSPSNIKHIQLKIDMEEYLAYMGLTYKDGTTIQEDLYNHMRKRITEYHEREPKKEGV